LAERMALWHHGLTKRYGWLLQVAISKVPFIVTCYKPSTVICPKLELPLWRSQHCLGLWLALYFSPRITLSIFVWCTKKSHDVSALKLIWKPTLLFSTLIPKSFFFPTGRMEFWCGRHLWRTTTRLYQVDH
jgi:hypothetical protein